MAVAYNSRRWLPGFLASLARLDYPPERLRLIVIDNGSTDDSVAYLRSAAASLPFQMDIVETKQNLGFAGGHNVGFQHGRSDYYFVVNLDTEVGPDAIDKLVNALESDPRAGIAEARQSPHEHPKYFDPVTGETSWCSGACMMIRPAALQAIGGGFEESFFMYAEDVDLSWRMWLRGWKCVYVRDAVVQHFTESLNTDKPPKFQHYHMMRNGALMRIMYDSAGEVLIHYLAMLRLAVASRNPWWHRRLTLKAAIASLFMLPAALKRRKALRSHMPHPWVFFDGWLYGRHLRDIALNEAVNETCIKDLTGSPGPARKRLGKDLPVDSHITHQSQVAIGSTVRPAYVVFDTGELAFDVHVPVGGRLRGWVAAPPDTWNNKAAGRFEIVQDGRVLQTIQLRLNRTDHRAWVEFDVPLRGNETGDSAQLVLRFVGERDLAWGLWGGVRVCLDKPVPPMEFPSPQVQTTLAISVVIPTHNRAEGVARVVHRLMAQDIDPDAFEIIVVDSNSRDNTPAALAALAARYPRLTALRCDKPGAAAARNMGINRAAAPLVLLLDDDILVAPDLLKRLLDAHRKHPERILLGNIVAPWEGTTEPFHRYLQQAQDVNIYDFKDDMDVPPNYFYTACVAIPKCVLRDTRFDEGFRVYGVEDIEFGFRLLTDDVRMIYLRDARVWHEYHPQFAEYARKKRRAGYSLGYFLKTHPQHAHRFTFERRVVKYHRWIGLACRLGTPVANVLMLWERVRRTTGPVNRPLFKWYYADLRIKMYGGLEQFRRGEEPPR